MEGGAGRGGEGEGEVRWTLTACCSLCDVVAAQEGSV